MPWPTPQDYNEAVQTPQIAFSDNDLRIGSPELNQLGLPRPRSGAFASVYKVQSGAHIWAARCFVKEVPDLQRRYAAITECLKNANLPYTVPFTYIGEGIKVKGRAYPLLKMEWIHGEPLNAFVGKTLAYPKAILSLAKVWLRVLADLRATNVAHGDLQHENVLVVGDQLRLIDYDGMFVPALAGQQSNELGHRNYQLPSRSKWDYGPYLDNFSAWVIYVSLAALAVHPELWKTYKGGDQCLIFRREDFVRPESSGLLRHLRASHNEQLRFLVDLFTSLFFLSPQDVPALDGNLPEVTPAPVTPWWKDFASTPRRRNEPVKPSQPSEHPGEADPSWIIEGLITDQPTDLVSFQSKPEQLRIVAVGSLAFALLTGLFIELPPTELFVWVSCVLGLNFLLCVARYSRDPSRAELKMFKNEAKKFVRRLKEHQTLIHSIAAERLAVQQDLAKAERKLLTEKNHIVEKLQKELAKNQAELDSLLQVINQGRQNTKASETAQLNSIQATLGTQIAELDRKIAAINQQEANEINKAISAIRDPFILAYLRQRPIYGSSIPGIGAAYKSRLIAAGFLTAADITWNVGRVNGIGPTRQSALMGWRQVLENQAMARAPSISPTEKALIQARHSPTRQSFEMERQRLQAQLNTQVTGIRQKFSDMQQALNRDEQKNRAANAPKRDRITSDYNSRIAVVELQIVAVRTKVASTVDDLSKKLRDAQKQSFALRWESAKHSHAGRRFGALHFRNYLRKVAFG